MGWDILHSVEHYNRHNGKWGQDGRWEPAERIRVTYEPDKYGLAIKSVYNEYEYELCPCQSARDYAVFGILSGVRVRDENKMRSVFDLKPRGFPNDVHELSVAVLNHGAYPDTISWATLDELQTWLKKNRKNIIEDFGDGIENFKFMVDYLEKIRTDLEEKFEEDIPPTDIRLIFGYNY